MPLVVPILRVSVLFLNVWETFKTVKLPRPNRSTGQPSVRAMTKRKRDMKGCLSVWIVWCCFAMYEATLDGIVGIFVPFYDEIKALFLLFLLVARARGAEPIYLHVLRPLLKPYVPLLDSMLEATALFGGFFVMLASIPIQYARSWWPGRKAPSHSDQTPQPDSDVSSISLNGYDMGGSAPSPPLNGRVPSQEASGARPSYSRNDTVRPKPSNGYPSTYSSTNIRTARVNGAPYPYAQSASSSSYATSHQIWHPPPSAYEEHAAEGNGAPAEGVSDHHSEDDEWRKYPPIPSAYPATPLTKRSNLPSLSGGKPGAEGIPEESLEAVDADDSGQGFDQSLKRAQNTRPSSDSGLSDDVEMTGVQEHYDNGPGISDAPTLIESLDETMVSDESSASDGSDYIEEDSFDISFRTPRPLRHASYDKTKSATGTNRNAKDDPFATVKLRDRDGQMSLRPMSVELTTSSSYQSQSTNLSTTDYGSSLRTAISRSPSHSSVSSSLSDTASVAGRKRSWRLNEIPKAKNTDTMPSEAEVERGLETEGLDAVAEEKSDIPRIVLRKASASSKAGSRTLRPPAPKMRPEVWSELFTEEEGDDELGTTDSEERAVRPGLKRRKIIAPSGETKPVRATADKKPAQERPTGLRPKTSSEGERRATRVRKRPDDQPGVARKPSSKVAPRRVKAKTAPEVTPKSNPAWK